MILVTSSSIRLFYVNIRVLFLGFHEAGSLWVAQTSDRLHTLKRQYSTAKALGVNCEILNVEKLIKKVPIIDSQELWV